MCRKVAGCESFKMSDHSEILNGFGACVSCPDQTFSSSKRAGSAYLMSVLTKVSKEMYKPVNLINVEKLIILNGQCRNCCKKKINELKSN